MASYLRKLLIGVSAAISVSAAGGTAKALCVTLGSPSVSPVALSLPAYDPFSTTDTVLDTTFTVTVPLVSVCAAALSFTRTAGVPGVMTQGGSTLRYSIELASGQTLMQTTGYISGSSPPSTARYDFLALLGIPTSVPVRFRIPAGQLVAAGTYSDQQVSTTAVGLGNLLGTAPTSLLSQQAFTPSVTVVTKCVLPAPSTTTLDFTSAISSGHPNPGVVQSSTFNNVQCTAPSILRLSGSAMQPVGSIPGRTNFDNFINWQASGTFGNASTALNTTSASQANSATKNTPSGVTTNGTINVNVNLVNGNPIIAGSYQGTLTVTIDPTL